MSTDDIENLFMDVLTELRTAGKDSEIQTLGLLKIKEFVGNYVESGETNAAKISTSILEDLENGILE